MCDAARASSLAVACNVACVVAILASPIGDPPPPSPGVVAMATRSGTARPGAARCAPRRRRPARAESRRARSDAAAAAARGGSHQDGCEQHSSPLHSFISRLCFPSREREGRLLLRVACYTNRGKVLQEGQTRQAYYQMIITRERQKIRVLGHHCLSSWSDRVFGSS